MIHVLLQDMNHKEVFSLRLAITRLQQKAFDFFWTGLPWFWVGLCLMCSCVRVYLHSWMSFSVFVRVCVCDCLLFYDFYFTNVRLLAFMLLPAALCHTALSRMLHRRGHPHHLYIQFLNVCGLHGCSSWCLFATHVLLLSRCLRDQHDVRKGADWPNFQDGQAQFNSSTVINYLCAWNSTPFQSCRLRICALVCHDHM